MTDLVRVMEKEREIVRGATRSLSETLQRDIAIAFSHAIVHAAESMTGTYSYDETLIHNEEAKIDFRFSCVPGDETFRRFGYFNLVTDKGKGVVVVSYSAIPYNAIVDVPLELASSKLAILAGSQRHTPDTLADAVLKNKETDSFDSRIVETLNTLYFYMDRGYLGDKLTSAGR